MDSNSDNNRHARQAAILTSKNLTFWVSKRLWWCCYKYAVHSCSPLSSYCQSTMNILLTIFELLFSDVPLFVFYSQTVVSPWLSQCSFPSQIIAEILAAGCVFSRNMLLMEKLTQDPFLLFEINDFLSCLNFLDKSPFDEASTSFTHCNILDVIRILSFF